MNVVSIADSTKNFKFDIIGLEFTENVVFEFTNKEPFSTKLASSEGPQISDYVTHENDFSYSTSGIHIAQDDRLTFISDNLERTIIGYFSDYRESSKTRGCQVEIHFSPSIYRKLIIPRGVSHSFDGLEGIITRDEPIWYMDDNNADWNINNDLVSVPKKNPVSSELFVTVNNNKLPDKAHLLFSQLQQHILQTPKLYSSREKIKVNGEYKYVMFEDIEWLKSEDKVSEIQNEVGQFSIDGVRVKKNKYAYTGSESYTIVPNTSSCVSDILIMNKQSDYFYYKNFNVYMTIMNENIEEVTITLHDLRKDKDGVREVVSLPSDPRINIKIPAGVAVKITSKKELIIRAEIEVLYNEAGELSVNDSLISVSENELANHIFKAPERIMPMEVVNILAKLETEKFFIGAE
ncbi:hypothetical protein [Endozoicomonas sp. ALE010]|uniref:hypothetical protein n=1 Tax=Endozoicomonas sp. ALE010 TaxID=3403081 RepID=UPI003BB4F0E3